jgi:hypothetical protein
MSESDSVPRYAKPGEVKRFLEENANFNAENGMKEAGRLFKIAEFLEIPTSFWSLYNLFVKYRHQKLGSPKRDSRVKDFILANADFTAKPKQEVDHLFKLSEKKKVGTTSNHIKTSFFLYRAQDLKFLNSPEGKKWQEKRKKRLEEKTRRDNLIYLKETSSKIQ